MTREYVGLLALDAAYLSIGAAALVRLGFRPLLHHAGLALMIGWAAFGVVSSVVLMLGGSLAGWRSIALLVATGTLALLLPSPRSAPAPTGPAPTPLRRWRFLGVATAAFVGLYALVLLASALVARSDINWDVWAFWLPKAQAIYYFDGLDTGAGGFTSFANPEYPPFAPATEAAAFHAMGTVETLALPLQHWVLAVAFFAALAGLLAPRVPAALLWPPLAMIALAPGVGRYFLSSLADPQVAYLITLAGVTAGLWLLERRRELVVLGALFLAAAALTKTEGFVLGVAIPVALALASQREIRARWRELLVWLAAPVAALAAWKLWLAVHDQPLGSELYSLGDAFRPAHLIDQRDRLAYAVEELARILLAPRQWLLVIPAVLVAAGLAAVTQRRLSTFVVVWLSIAFFGLASVYWISSVDVRWYVDTSAGRVVVSIAFFAAGLTPLLAAEASRTKRP